MIRAMLALTVCALLLFGCDRAPAPQPEKTADVESPEPPDEPSPAFRNVDRPTAYVGDASCSSCHAREASVYRQHAMSRSFHRWTPGSRVEPALATPLENKPTGLTYTVAEEGGRLFQVERLTGPDGRRLHELRRRIDWVMGSGEVARTYFTEENGRLFQLPLTWYRQHGWDFSPGYEINNARFDRLLPDRCLSCHASYPRTLPALEGKFAEVRPGIGCERCHGPGALHVQERRAGAKRDSAFDRSIVNPARLPLQRRMETCEQCHVHTAVTVPREGRNDFSYMPSQPLRDQYAFFKTRGSIDIVSHADRLRQSACFVATRATPKPLECATCHNPHLPPSDAAARNQPCQTCHAPSALQQRLTRSASLGDHGPAANCVSCHMPRVQERAVPHGSFTDHWIRDPNPNAAMPAVQGFEDGPIAPFFDRDRKGPDAPIYRGMGGIVYATLANDGRTLRETASALDVALRRDSLRGDAQFLLGVAYHQLGNEEGAIRALERSVRADSNRPDRLRALAQAYQRAGRPPASIDGLYRRALDVQPALAWIRADRADYLRSQGRLDEAAAEYRSALAEQPSLAVGWFNLATLLAEQGRAHESSTAFQRAVGLDPFLAAALSPLLEVTVAGSEIARVQVLASPIATLPVRDRGPRATQLRVAADTASRGVEFVNVPSRGLVQILRPDGTIIRALPSEAGGLVRWDLLTDAGRPVDGGLFRARAVGRDPSGRVLAPQLFYFGIVRRRPG